MIAVMFGGRCHGRETGARERLAQFDAAGCARLGGCVRRSMLSPIGGKKVIRA